MTPPLQASHPGWVLVTLIAVIAVLNFADAVFIPLALAILLAFLLSPIVDRLQDWGCNRVIAVVLTTIVTLVLVGGLLFIVAGQFLGLVEKLPHYKENLREKIKTLRVPGGGSLQKGVEAVFELSEEVQTSAPGTVSAPRSPKCRSCRRRQTPSV